MRIVVIYFIVLLFYMLVAVVTVVCVGVSMAHVEATINDQEVYRMIIREVSPALVYVLALFVLALVTLLTKRASVVKLAIELMFVFHFAWFPLFFVYRLVEPLAPELLSGYSSPGSIALRFVSSAWPFYMLAVFSYVCVSEWSTKTHNPELELDKVGLT